MGRSLTSLWSGETPPEKRNAVTQNTWAGPGVVGSRERTRDRQGVIGIQEMRKMDGELVRAPGEGEVWGSSLGREPLQTSSRAWVGAVGEWELQVSLLPMLGTGEQGSWRCQAVWKPGWAPGMHKDGLGAGGPGGGS